MKTCPDCNTENSDIAGFCSKCSAALPRSLNISSSPIDARLETYGASEAEASDTERIMKRAEGYLSKLDSQMYCHRCGLAAMLSALLPGLGQIYSEQIGKGIAMVAAWAIGGFFYGRWCINSMIRGAKWGELGLEFSHFLVGLVFVGLWIFAIVDAACAPERVR